MPNKEPFRSRPRVTRNPKSSEPVPPEAFDPIEEDIIEGVMEEHEAQQLVPTSPRVYEPIALPPEEYATFTAKEARVAQPGLLLIAIGLFVGGIFITLLRVADLPDVIEAWWPIVSLIVAVGWTFLALLRRNVANFLAGAVVAGISMSLLLDAQSVAQFQETVVGIILMTFGLAIVMRGLFLRQVEL